MLSTSCLSFIIFYLLTLRFTVSVEIDSRYPDSKVEVDPNEQLLNSEIVDLKVYYDVWCRGCRRFHTKQLYPTYKKIGSYIHFKTYPYGGAVRSEDHGKVSIDCPEGPEECYGNKLHACAIDILKNVSLSEFYNVCMMNGTWGGKGSTDKDAIHCGKLMQIDSKPIMECAKSQRGEDLLEYYGEETDKVTDPRSKYMPFILFNGKEYKGKDLMETICKTLTKPPPQCNQYF